MSAEKRRPADETGHPQQHHPHDALSVPQTVHLGEEQGPRRIGLDIDLALLRYDGRVYTVALTAAEARRTAIFLLDMAADVERIAATEVQP